MLQSFFCAAVQRYRSAIQLGMVLCLLIIGIGCAPGRQTIDKFGTEAEWKPWQVLEAKTGRILSFPEWTKRLESYEIVYLGEEHHNKHHIEAALRILRSLSSAGVQPTIGMEMFGWDGQPALDEYLANDQPGKSEFLERVRWKQNWGGAFEDYEPLVTFARDRHLSVRAMNPPKPLIRRVVKLGLEQARQESEWERWGLQQEEIVDDPAYRTRIVDQLARCHGGGTDEHYRMMYEASMVRDEGMAKTLVAILEEQRQNQSGTNRIIVSYTGSGHIQYNLPIPMRVARRLSGHVKQTTIHLTSFDPDRIPDIQELIQEQIADYIWLTPISGRGLPRPCR